MRAVDREKLADDVAFKVWCIGYSSTSTPMKESAISQLTHKLRDLQEAVIFEKTNALLMRVSEKVEIFRPFFFQCLQDERIALLEEIGGVRFQNEIKQLRLEREEDVVALKEQFAARSALQSSDELHEFSYSNSTVDDLKEKLEVCLYMASKVQTHAL